MFLAYLACIVGVSASSADASRPLRFDGLYFGPDGAVLRFLEDGQVFSAIAVGETHRVGSWLGTSDDQPHATYAVVGTTLRFTINYAHGAIHYEGSVLPGAIELGSYVERGGIKKVRARSSYSFREASLTPHDPAIAKLPGCAEGIREAEEDINAGHLMMPSPGLFESDEISRYEAPDGTVITVEYFGTGCEVSDARHDCRRGRLERYLAPLRKLSD